jgi:hypothetical protein
MNHYLRKYLIKICCIIDEIILLMLKLVSNKIDTYLMSLWRHERYLFSVFRGILTAIFPRFSKKLSTFAVVHQFFWWHWRRIAFTEFFSWFQCTQTVFKINTIIYRNVSYLLMNFITWNESWNVQKLCMTSTVFHQHQIEQLFWA